MKKIGIYKIISPSNKIYIGQSVNIERRWKGHKDYKSIGPKLINSYKKYGFENHIREIIEECSIDKLDERETYWKQYYLNQHNGDWNKMLFCELYDNGGGPRSETTKQKMSLSQKENLSKPEVKEKRKTNCKIAANKPGVQEKAVANTDWETRNKKLQKSVIQYNIDGEIVKMYPSLIDIQHKNKDKKWWAAEIGLCCRGKIPSKYGFIWKFK